MWGKVRKRGLEGDAMVYRFGDYILDPDRHELLHQGERVELRPKVFQVLAYLVENRDRAISREELVTEIWEGDSISEAALSTLVKLARQAVGDTGRRQRCILTLRSIGFRWVGDVTIDDDDDFGELTRAETSGVLGTRRLPTPEIAPLGDEYKKVSVMVCGFAFGGSAHAGDIEARHELLHEVKRIAGGIVAALKGVLLGTINDRVVGLFGAPVAYEDHAHRALLAAAALRDRMPRGLFRSPAGGAATPFSVGLHVGRVVFRAGNKGEPPTATAVGDTISLAEQLQGGAPAGQIWLSSAVEEATRGHARLDAVEVGAPDGSLPTYRLAELCEGGPWLHAAFSARKHLAPFLGRDADMAQLQARLDQVKQSRGQAIGVLGAAGLGKSRLLREFVNGLGGSAKRIIVGHCASYSTNTPYFPVRQLLQQALDVKDDASVEEAQKAIEATLRRSAIDANPSDVTLLLDVLLPGKLDIKQLEDALPGSDPTSRRQRTFHLLSQLFIAEARRGLLVVVVDDLHWIDATSEEWLTRLAGEIAALPVLLLTGYRPGRNPPWLRLSYAMQHSLTPITNDAAQGIVRSLLRHRSLRRPTIEMVLTKAEGNPFFLEELACYLVERDAESAEQPRRTIPDTLTAVLTARIDRLSTRNKRVLQVASAVGHHFNASVLTAITGFSEEKLRQSLDELIGAEFIHPIDQRSDPTMEFRHALAQEVVYQALTVRARCQLHHDIADLLETRYADLVDHRPEVLALHRTEGGSPERALPLWLRAAERATERAAHPEAISHLERGLALLEHVPHSRERDLNEIRLQLALADVLSTTKGYAAPEVEEAYNHARALCDALGDPPELFQVLCGLSQSYFLKGRHRDADSLEGQLVDHAERSGNLEKLTEAYRLRGLTRTLLGELDAAKDDFLNAKELLLERTIGPGMVKDYDRGVMSLAYLANTYWILGYPDRALSTASQMQDMVRGVSHPFVEVVRHHMHATLLVMVRDCELALSEARASMSLSDEFGFMYYRAASRVLCGWALAKQGSIDSGLQAAREGLELFGAPGSAAPYTVFAALFADVLLSARMFDEGTKVLSDAIAWADRREEYVYYPELYRLKGEFALGSGLQGGRLAADTCFETAMKRASDMGARSWQLRAALSAANHATDDRRPEAQLELRKIYATFEEGFDTPDLRAASATLGEASTEGESEVRNAPR